ncbi:MAG: hypothetical protein R3E94_18365 [Burkholderiaceae bacterium]
MTLGRHSGAAVIGRPLDIRAQVQLAPGESLDELCLSADVFYGDSQVGMVRTQTQQPAPDAQASLRIQTSQAINEPIVTVYVRAGCQAPFTRRYVLLADPVNEPVTAPSAVNVPTQGAVRTGPAGDSTVVAETKDGGATPSSSSSSDAGPASAAASPSAPSGATGTARIRSRAPARASAASEAPRKPASVVRRAAPAPAPGPRLQLDPPDLSLDFERDPVLRLSLTLLSEPATSEDVREAAGLLWKALNATPEEILGDARKLAVLEAEAKGLRDEEARKVARIAELEARLQENEQRSWLTYGLAVLLLASLLGLAVLMRRRRQQAWEAAKSKAWWDEEAARRPLQDAHLAAEDEGVEGDAVDIDLGIESDFQHSASSSLSPLSRPAVADSTPSSAVHGSEHQRPFVPSAIGVSRSVATEELIDVQQQADFFVSLGEDEQAIHVLRSHLSESQEPSPLAYLDLLKLYHRLDRRSEYDALRKEFNNVFNAGAPQFEQFSDSEGQGLEDYETAMGRIQALWPQPRVLDVIEQSIFRDPGDQDGEVFDLEAYRELLLLHALAKDIIRKDERDTSQDDSSRPGFRHTKIQPLKAVAGGVAGVASPTEPMPMDITPPASVNVGLDVDLDELAELSAFEASLPDVSIKVEPTARNPGAADKDDALLSGNLIDFEVLDFLHSSKDDARDSLKGDQDDDQAGKGGADKA